MKTTCFLLLALGVLLKRIECFILSSDNRTFATLKSGALQANNGNNNDQETTPYRSIGEVVGGLHGGKYQFTPGGSFGDSGYAGRSSAKKIQEQEQEIDPEQMPKWAQRMNLPDGIESSMSSVQILEVPSNSNRMDGMTRSATVKIQNDEITWEEFFVKLLPRHFSVEEAASLAMPFRVRPRTGHLAPRGGASNACDSSQPYSDSATITVFYDESVADAALDGSIEWWLVAGTEEEKWYFKIKHVL